LLYLTPEEEYNNGAGELSIYGDDETNKTADMLKPVRGNVALLDFTNHNPHHEVKKIFNNFRRYCYITFLWNTDKIPPELRPRGYK
jgi:hypothetical protein